MQDTNRQQLHRAAAIALWPHLIHATTHGWPEVKAYTVYDPTGRGRTGGYSTASNIPGPLPKTVSVVDDGRILAELKPDKWPGNAHLAVRLWQSKYEALYKRLPLTTYRELLDAYFHDHHRRPFVQATNRHGTPVLRRQNHPDTRITQAVAAFLEAVAAAADIEIVTPELEAALLTDDDVPETIRATEVFAIAQKAGIEPSE